MKLNGSDILIREVVPVTLKRNGCATVTLKVTGYPVGIQRAYEAIVPRPTPPLKGTGVSTVKGGEKLEKDFSDPAYARALDEWLFLQKFFYLYHCLSVTEGLEFSAKPTSADGLLAISEEFKSAGFSEGDIGQIMTAIHNATHIRDEDIAEAKQTF